jgi:hypothetical protein
MSEEGAFGEATIERFGWMKVSFAWPGRDLEVETRFLWVLYSTDVFRKEKHFEWTG